MQTRPFPQCPRGLGEPLAPAARVPAGRGAPWLALEPGAGTGCWQCRSRRSALPAGWEGCPGGAGRTLPTSAGLSLWRSPTRASSCPCPAFSPFIRFAFQEWARPRCSAHGQSSLRRLRAPGGYGPATLRCSAPRTAPGTCGACADSADSVNPEASRVWTALSRAVRLAPPRGHARPRGERRVVGVLEQQPAQRTVLPCAGFGNRVPEFSQRWAAGGRKHLPAKPERWKSSAFPHCVNRKVEGTAFQNNWMRYRL